MNYLRRYDANKDLTPADREAVADLVRRLGHADDDISAVFAITVDGIGTRLHLTEFLRNEMGFRYRDMAADHLVSRPHVHDIADEQLPEAIRPTAEAVTR